MHRWIAAVAVPGVFSLFGCGSGDAANEFHVDSLPSLAVTAERRVGDRDNPELGFSFIYYVDVDRDGNVYVLDGQDRQIRVYTPDLSPVRRIGRAGSGPGEFQRVPRFGVVGDTVWAIDDGRITLFSREGTILSTGNAGRGLRIPLTSSYGHVRPLAMRADGLFTSELNMVSYSSSDPPTGVQATDSVPVPRVLFDASGRVVDTVGWDESPPPRMWRPPGSYRVSRIEVIEIDGGRFRVPEPPIDMPSWSALNDGQIIVYTPQPTSGADTTFTVTRLGLARDTVYHTTITYSPESYESAELDSIALSSSRGIVSSVSPAREPSPAVAARLRAEMEFPEYRLPVRTSWVSQDASTWLLRGGEQAPSARWIVLGPDGRPRGQVRLPARSRVVWHVGDSFLASEPDEMDIPWLVVYRITTGGEPGGD